MSDKAFEIVIYGATSFVGKILCHYLCDELKDPELRWAMAGRSESKILQLKQELGDTAESIPHFIAEATDEKSLEELCNKTDVIISTVGSYALYGETLVKVCAQSGTDYCDLTGEPQWIKRMIDKYQDSAQASGARIVHCCGFDSIPSDLGVHFLQQLAKQRFGAYCPRVKMRVKGSKGGASGGTIASMVNLYKEASANPQLRKELGDPYSICPPSDSPRTKQPTVDVEFDEDFQSWVGPFVMAAINTRVVLRSNELSEPKYNNSFVYDEATLTGNGPKSKKLAKRISTGLKLIVPVMAIPPFRWLALKFLPKPGEGPSEEQQLNGYYDLIFMGYSENKELLQVQVTGDRDPGYGSTAKMLAQAGICLARDISHDKINGGFWTPATAMGQTLISRLVKYAGMTFDELKITQDKKS
jgi:short subunit dehydrogenase-like uncharacterized protein